MTPDEAEVVLDKYAAAHPRAWAALKPVLASTLGNQEDTTAPVAPMMALTLLGS
jgi:hypothetical protein